MQNLTAELLPRLESHRLDGVDAGSGSIYPFYEGGSLVNLPGSICHWLGAPEFGAQPLLPEILNQHAPGARHVILLVIDGMGLNTLEVAVRQAQHDSNLAVWEDLTASGCLAPMTSIAPSTTAAALTTFWTGAAPAQHGVVAYEVWLKEYGVIANMILHSPACFYGDVGSLRKGGFDPETFLPVKTLGRHLGAHGVRVFAHQHQAIARSGLSTMLLQGAEIVPFRSLSDLWVSMNGVLDAHAVERTYSYIYWGDLDEHSHRYGPEDERVGLELAAFSRQLEYFLRARRKRDRGDTLLLITADHGHIFTPKKPEYEVRNHPELLDCMVMFPSGEARMPLVYLRPGREEKFLRYLETTWPGEFLAMPSEQAVQAGLFGTGEVYPPFRDRIGDWVVFPQGDAYWWFSPSRDNPLLGRHGGLNRTEMLVPLVSIRL